MSAASAVPVGVLLGLVIGLSLAAFAVVWFAIKKRLYIRRTLAAFDLEFPRRREQQRRRDLIAYVVAHMPPAPSLKDTP